MKIRSEDLVGMLKKMDEVEEKASYAFSSCDSEDLQIAVEKMRELRSMLYSLLATGQEEPAVYPAAYPVIVPYREVPWWEQVTYACKSASSTGGSATEAE